MSVIIYLTLLQKQRLTFENLNKEDKTKCKFHSMNETHFFFFISKVDTISQ